MRICVCSFDVCAFDLFFLFFFELLFLNKCFYTKVGTFLFLCVCVRDGCVNSQGNQSPLFHTFNLKLMETSTATRI
jgi:hypothetical protein